MKRWFALVVVSGMAIALAGVGLASPSTTYYWSSFEAGLAVEQSDWGDARKVDTANCRGLGAFKKAYGSFTFARFRCELDDRNFNRIGFVTIRTTGPEAWKAENFIKPRC